MPAVAVATSGPRACSSCCTSLLFAIIGLVQSPADLGNEVVFVNSGKEGDAPDGAGADAKGNDAIGAAQRGARAAAADAAAKASPAAEKAATAGPSAAAGDQSAPGAIDDDTLIGLDRDLNLILRLSGAELPVPDAVRKRYDHFKRLPKEEKAERLYAGALRYGPYAMVALLPAFAFLQMLAYLGRGGRYPGRPRRYAEHLVYSAHLHAFAALAIIGADAAADRARRALLLGAWIVYYVIRARQVVYGGRWWAGLLRSSIIAIRVPGAGRAGDRRTARGRDHAELSQRAHAAATSCSKRPSLVAWRACRRSVSRIASS